MRALKTITVGDHLRQAAVRYAARPAIVDVHTGQRLNYRELNQRANRLANGLLGLGINRGDFASILLPNGAAIVEVYFALAKIGVVAAPLVYRLSPGELQTLINHAGSRVFIYHEKFEKAVEEIRPGLTNIEYFIRVGSPHGADLDYEQLTGEGDATEPEVVVSDEDPQYLNCTSGTTGLPKSYILTQYNNAVSLVFLMDDFRVFEEDVVATVFPIYSRTGFGWSVEAVFKGATNVVLDFEPQLFLETVQREKVTVVNFVPTMAQMLLLQPNLIQYDMSSLRAVMFVGSALPQSVYQGTMERLCPTVYEFYGLQETGNITQIKPADKVQRPNSVGQLSPGVDLRVVDDDDRDVTHGQLGEVIMRGCAATIGYFNEPVKTAEVFRNGWMHTGDIGYLDEEGFLYIAGRKKDVIITGGQNVFAIEVEDVILSHPSVADVGVIGLPDDYWVEKVTAVVIPKTDVQLTEEEIINYCKERLAHFKAPKKIIWTDNIPRNPAGKIQKFILVERYK
ncbi:MAG: class I adenylate-forming enzyme family protein [Bacillota bacterium]